MPRTPRGFTLVEVLVALSIIALLMAITIPDYIRGRPAKVMAQTGSNIAASLNFARTTAIKNNAPTYVEFIPELDMYRVWDQPAWEIYSRRPLTGFSSVYPLKEAAPILNYSISPVSLGFIERNYSTTRAISSEGAISDDVDIRMGYYSCIGHPVDQTTIIGRNGMLSRAPLMFIKFFPDGKAANSWDIPCLSGDTALQILTPNLGYSQITLQVRGGYNIESGLDFIPNVDDISDGDINVIGVPYPDPIKTPNQTLPYEAATSDQNGRRIFLNHANGRVTVEAFAPYLIDVPDGTDDDPDFRSAFNQKEWI